MDDVKSPDAPSAVTAGVGLYRHSYVYFNSVDEFTSRPSVRDTSHLARAAWNGTLASAAVALAFEPVSYAEVQLQLRIAAMFAEIVSDHLTDDGEIACLASGIANTLHFASARLGIPEGYDPEESALALGPIA